MRIIIAGAGDVGFHLAKLLAYEEQDIILIDLDQEKLKYAANHLDVATIRGSSTSYSVLLDANISKADLLISVTSNEETNIATCIIGKNLGAKRTVARISNIEFLLGKDILDLKTIGIDEIISPESLAAKEIKRLLRESALTDTFDFDNGLLSLVGITIDDNGELAEKTLSETAYLNPDNSFTTVAILRNNETIIPHGENSFKANDHAYFISAVRCFLNFLLNIGLLEYDEQSHG
jgi:trk system potassium uptake protein TrkA